MLVVVEAASMQAAAAVRLWVYVAALNPVSMQ
jgi:hypothetical protein